MKKLTHLKNIIIGMGSIMDIYPNTKSVKIPSPYSNTSDAEALANDWKNVGNDMRLAMGQVSEEQEK